MHRFTRNHYIMSINFVVYILETLFQIKYSNNKPDVITYTQEVMLHV